MYYIDLHLHYKKVKSGENKNRNRNPEEILRYTADNTITILTAHDDFDISFFKKIYENKNNEKSYYPAIEIQTDLNEKKIHLNIISNPEEIVNFSTFWSLLKEKMVDGTIPFVSLMEFLKNQENINVKENMIISIHYKKGEKSVSEDKYLDLKNSFDNLGIVFVGDTSSLSTLGLYNDYNSDLQVKLFFGTDDNKDIKEYNSTNNAKIKFEPSSFIEFRNFLKYDKNIITKHFNYFKFNEHLINIGDNKKDSFKIKIYNELNIITGSKGTGKSVILEKIKNEITDKFGYSELVYFNGSDSYNTIEQELNKSLSDFKENYKNTKKIDFEKIKGFINEPKMIFEKFMDYYTNENKKIDLVINYKPNLFDQNESDRHHSLANYFKEIKDNVDSWTSNDIYISDHISEKTKKNIDKFLKDIKDDYQNYLKNNYLEYLKENFLRKHKDNFNKSITKFKGKNLNLPDNVGYYEYFSNYNSLYNTLNDLKKEVNKKSNNKSELKSKLGSLSKNNNKYRIKVVSGFGKADNYKSLKLKNASNNVKPGKHLLNKTEHDRFLKIINDLSSVNVLEIKEKLNNIDNFKKINVVKDLVRFGVHIYNEEEKNVYVPSNGEISTFALNIKLLNVDKKKYVLLDEPEIGFDNKYLSKVFNDQIQDLLRDGKYIIIATHNPTIAINNSPINHIHREYDNGYKTFIGNIFLRKFENIKDDKDVLDWKEVVLDTLEGSKKNFLNRGEIYGIERN